MARAVKPWTDTQALKLARTKVTVSTDHHHPTVPGFFMRVSPKGKAVWAYRIRDANGQLKGKNIAEVAPVTGAGAKDLTDALEAFQKIRDQLKKLDSRAIRTGKGTTLAQAFETWKQEHESRRGGVLSSETMKDYQGVYERILEQEAGGWSLAASTAFEWKSVLDKYVKRSASQTRRAYYLLHSIYSDILDLDPDFCARNPLSSRQLRQRYAGVQAKAAPRQKMVQTMDLAKFVMGVLDLRNRDSRDAILTLLLSSWRRSGVLRLRWAQVDFDAGVYNVRPGDIGWKGFVGEVAINEYVLGTLQERYQNRTSTEYVFPARHGSKPYMQDVRTSIANACNGMGYVVGKHDLRRTFATVAGTVLNGNTLLIGHLLAHKNAPSPMPGAASQQGSSTTAGYIVRDLQAEREASRRVAEVILELGGVLPLDDSTVRMYPALALDQRKPLDLVPVSDLTRDDSEDEEKLAQAA